MVITFQMEGGVAHFPGLARPITILDADLAPGELDELRGLIGAARFFDEPAADPPGPAAVDAQRYVISIAEAGRSHTLRRHDPVGPPPLADLVAYVRKKAISVLRARAKPPVP